MNFGKKHGIIKVKQSLLQPIGNSIVRGVYIDDKM